MIIMNTGKIEFKVDRKGRVLGSLLDKKPFQKFPTQPNEGINNYKQKNKLVVVTKKGHFYTGNRIVAQLVPGGVVNIHLTTEDEDFNTVAHENFSHTEIYDFEVAERRGTSNHGEIRQIFRHALSLLNASYESQEEKNEKWSLAISIINNINI
jgi:hypothetical protein